MMNSFPMPGMGKVLQITEPLTVPVFVGVFLATIAADYLIDKQYVYLLDPVPPARLD